MVCTFFGHRDCPADIMPELEAVIEDLINHKSVNTFYVGNNGNYDLYVKKALQKLSAKYPQIKYTVVFAYIPVKHKNEDYENTLIPEGIENVPRRFAISYRNKWLVKQADYVVTYITHNYGGAAQFAALAEKKSKICINLYKK